MYTRANVEVAAAVKFDRENKAAESCSKLRESDKLKWLLSLHAAPTPSSNWPEQNQLVPDFSLSLLHPTKRRSPGNPASGTPCPKSKRPFETLKTARLRDVDLPM